MTYARPAKIEFSGQNPTEIGGLNGRPRAWCQAKASGEEARPAEEGKAAVGRPEAESPGARDRVSGVAAGYIRSARRQQHGRRALATRFYLRGLRTCDGSRPSDHPRGAADLRQEERQDGLAAGLCLCHLSGPESEKRGQCYSAASDRDQAALIFDECVAMIIERPWLDARLHIKDFNKEIKDRENGSVYKALSSDNRKAHGKNTSFAIYDELAQAPNRKLYDNLFTSSGARAEPLFIVISTQSDDSTHVMSELVDYAESIAAGEIEEPTFHGAVYRVPEEADIWDEANWALANPGLGSIRSLDEMRMLARKAKRIPGLESAFRSLYMNQRVETVENFIPKTEWLACGGAIDKSALQGRRCFGGLDLSSTRDLTSFALYFPDDDGALLSWSWLPEHDLADRADKDRRPYQDWVKRGYLETSPGRSISYLHLATRLGEICADFDVERIGYDQWHFRQLEVALDADGITLPFGGLGDDKAFGQGYKSMAPSVNSFEAAVFDRDIRHTGNPVLTWCLSNVRMMRDPAGNRKPTKENSRGRIDAFVAALMAVGLAKQPVASEEKPQPRGVLRMSARDWFFYLLGGGRSLSRPRQEPAVPVPAQIEARVTNPEPHPGETRFVFLPPQLGGVRITEETAIQVMAVWACIYVIAKALASSQWGRVQHSAQR